MLYPPVWNQIPWALFTILHLHETMLGDIILCTTVNSLMSVISTEVNLPCSCGGRRLQTHLILCQENKKLFIDAILSFQGSSSDYVKYINCIALD